MHRVEKSSPQIKAAATCAAHLDPMSKTIHTQVDTRLTLIGQHLDQEAPHVRTQQRHLDAGSAEQAYWHLGYECALRDILELLRDEADVRSTCIASRFPKAVLDA